MILSCYVSVVRCSLFMSPCFVVVHAPATVCTMSDQVPLDHETASRAFKYKSRYHFVTVKSTKLNNFDFGAKVDLLSKLDLNPQSLKQGIFWFSPLSLISSVFVNKLINWLSTSFVRQNAPLCKRV